MIGRNANTVAAILPVYNLLRKIAKIENSLHMTAKAVLFGQIGGLAAEIEKKKKVSPSADTDDPCLAAIWQVECGTVPITVAGKSNR